MRFKDLGQEDYELIEKVYNDSESREDAQGKLALEYGVTTRTIRNWAYKLELGVMSANVVQGSKILIYDIETSRVPAMVWWTGKQYVSADQLLEEPKIITIAWKWLGDDRVYDITWDDYQSDEAMLITFLKEYNKADMVIGQNNDRFDNRWVNARAAKYDVDVNTMVRSFDIMKESKQKFRLPSYSMKYMCKYFDVEQKLEHEGIKMWGKIQRGTPEEQNEYLKKMVDYNRGDIVSTEALYYRLRRYFGHRSHLGVKKGEERWSCPDTGSHNVSLYKTTVTPAGTVQRIMESTETGVKYRITNKQYMNWLEFKINKVEK